MTLRFGGKLIRMILSLPRQFLQALSCLLGRWLLIRSEAPAMDAVTVLCQARAYVVRHENVEANATKDALQHRDLKI